MELQSGVIIAFKAVIGRKVSFMADNQPTNQTRPYTAL